MRMRVGRAMAAVVVVGAVLSGCGVVAQPGAAVILGDRTLPLDQVETDVHAALSDPARVDNAAMQGQELPDLARAVVSSRIIDSVVEYAASQAGIVITPSQVDDEIAAILRQAGPALANVDPARLETELARVREALPTQLAAVELARRTAAGISVTVDEVATRDRASAERLAGVLAAGGPAAEAELAAAGAELGRTYTATGDPERAGSVLFGVPQGSVLAYQPDPGNASWSVARVTQRRTDTAADPAAISRLSQDQLLFIGIRAAQASAGNQPITVNPRYGVWDPIRGGLTEESDLSGLVLLPA